MTDSASGKWVRPLAQGAECQGRRHGPMGTNFSAYRHEWPGGLFPPSGTEEIDPVKSKSGHAPALLKTFQWLPSHSGQGQSPYGGPKFLHALLPSHSLLTSLLPSILLPQLYRIPDVPQTHCLIHRSYLECSPPADPHGSHLPLLQVLAQRSPPQRGFP